MATEGQDGRPGRIPRAAATGERPRDADERGQRTTRADVLTAQFPWERAPPPSSPPTTATTISFLLLLLLLPSLLIAPANKSSSRLPLTRLAASSCVHFLAEPSHELRLNLSCSKVHVSSVSKCVCVCLCVCVCVCVFTLVMHISMCDMLVSFFNQGPRASRGEYEGGGGMLSNRVAFCSARE